MRVVCLPLPLGLSGGFLGLSKRRDGLVHLVLVELELLDLRGRAAKGRGGEVTDNARSRVSEQPTSLRGEGKGFGGIEVGWGQRVSAPACELSR